MSTKPLWIVFLFLLLLVPVVANGQTVPAARGGDLNLFAGGTLSAFQPDYGNAKLGGFGAYVDFGVNRWLNIEGQARWLRIHQRQEVHEDNYLIGAMVPIRKIREFTPYGKFLIGVGELNFPYSYAHGGYANVVFGGGVDYRFNRRWRIRVVDFEYQQWLNFTGGGTLQPYGISVGTTYRIF